MANYGTEEGLADYAAETGATVPAGDVLPALVRASAYIDGRYGLRFAGSRAGGYAQELAWPRTGAMTAEGFSVPADEIPAAVERATYEAALRELASPGSLTPDYTASAVVKRKKVGPIEKEYAVSGAATVNDVRPVVTVIEEMLALLLVPKLPAVLVV